MIIPWTKNHGYVYQPYLFFGDVMHYDHDPKPTPTLIVFYWVMKKEWKTVTRVEELATEDKVMRDRPFNSIAHAMIPF